MTLTASEVSSITDTLTKWEYAEYFFTALVAVACLGEYLADFTRVWARGGLWARLGPIEDRKERFAKLSTLLLIAALALELLCLVRTNQLSGLVIGSLDERSNEAMTKSAKALGDSTSAVAQSGMAKSASAKAISESGRAVVQSSKALKEADSFEADIAVAKKQAAEAESQSTQQRNLIISRLSAARGTAIDFVVIGDTAEVQALGLQILGCLQTAGWNVSIASPFGGGVAVKGVVIGVRSNSGPEIIGAVNNLASSLRDAGIVVGPGPFEQMQVGSGMRSGTFGNAAIRMFVGSKP